MKIKPLLTHAVAMAVAVGSYSAVQPGEPAPGLPVLSDFSLAYRAPGDFMTFAPTQDPLLGVYKPFINSYGDSMLVAFFDPAQLELREKPTHMMQVVVNDSTEDRWFARNPRLERVLDRLGDVVHLSRIADDSTYGRLEVVAVCTPDTAVTFERWWEVEQ